MPTDEWTTEETQVLLRVWEMQISRASLMVLLETGTYVKKLKELGYDRTWMQCWNNMDVDRDESSIYSSGITRYWKDRPGP